MKLKYDTGDNFGTIQHSAEAEGSNKPYPVYYINPFNNADTTTFVINYLLHQVFNLIMIAVGICFFLTISAQLFTVLFSSIASLLLTSMLAGLLAFPVAAHGSILIAAYVRKPESQHYLFLILALTCQIIFNVLLLASSYFFALCALYTVAAFIGLALVSIVSYCLHPTPAQDDDRPEDTPVIIDQNTPERGIQHSPISDRQSWKKRNCNESPNQDTSEHYLAMLFLSYSSPFSSPSKEKPPESDSDQEQLDVYSLFSLWQK
jgi:hypothetical protein